MDSSGRWFTWANLITAVRLVWALALLVLCLTAESLEAYRWPIVLLSLCSLCLDGVDGWVARRSGTASPLGARFDMETDAFFILVLCLAAWQLGFAGAWVFLLGAMRYGFVAAGLLLPRMRQPLPERWWRKGICVVQVAALVLVLVPWIPASVAPFILGLALALLAGSFTRDSVWLMTHYSHRS